VGVFESNLHVVKSDVLPVTILEHYYRKHPELLSKAHITNAVQVSDRVRYALREYV
jgi:hypothetical protein